MLKKIYRIDGTIGIKFSVYDLQEIKQQLNENPETIVIIDSTEFDDKGRHCFPNRDLDILKDLPIKHLFIYGSWCQNYEGIKNLKSLETLDVSMCLNFDFDFSENTKIKYLELSWSKKVKKIDKLTSLQTLRLLKYKSVSFDLTELFTLQKLQKFSIAQSNIKSLRGLENCFELKVLNLAYCKELSMENTLVFPSVKSLYIEKCPKLSATFRVSFPNAADFEIFGMK